MMVRNEGKSRYTEEQIEGEQLKLVKRKKKSIEYHRQLSNRYRLMKINSVRFENLNIHIFTSIVTISFLNTYVVTIKHITC